MDVPHGVSYEELHRCALLSDTQQAMILIVLSSGARRTRSHTHVNETERGEGKVRVCCCSAGPIMPNNTKKE
jgi:hypothetical protein